MEILNYDIETHSFVKTSKNLGDMVTKVRELNWDYSEKDYEFDLRYMKIVDTLFKEKIKIQSKRNTKSNEDAELVKYLYSQIPKPKENTFKCNIVFYGDDLKSLRIDYFCLSSIVNIIMNILDNIINQFNFPQLLSEVIEQNNFSRIMDIALWGKSIMKYKDEFKEVENISFCLSSSHDDNINIYYVILFSYFYKVLFPKVKSVTINLNEVRINNVYNIDKNPYKIRESDVVLFCKKFENLFLSNLIITSLLTNYDSLHALRIIMSESFINEINYIIDKEFEKSHFKEMISKKISLIYFRKLMMIKKISKLSITINSLDIFLFKEIINLIALHTDAQELELQLFSEPKFFNLRKLYLNYLTGQEFQDIDPNIIEKYQIIMYPYIDSLDESIIPLIEEEKIPDLLFPFFKKNINNLKLILNDYVKNYKTFYLDISPYEELCKYDNYNIEIILFVFVVLCAFENSSLIKTLQLKCLNINYSSVLHIKKKINKLISGKLIDLSNCKELENLGLNMEGISLLLDFNTIPVDNLKKLSFELSTLQDVKALSEYLKNKKKELIKLTEFKLSITINDSEKIFDELLKILENIPCNLETLKLTIENNIGKKELVKIVKAMNKNMNLLEKLNNLSLHCNSRELDNYLDENKINNLKEYLHEKNANFVGKCKSSAENRRITLSLLKWPKLDILTSIMLSFNKIVNNSEVKNSKKIFSKIFDFMGKSQDFFVFVN